MVAFPLLLAAWGCSGRPTPRLDSAVASALADSFAAALHERFELRASARFGVFADPATGDSIPGYVVSLSAPYEMVAGDTIPHDWLRAQLAGDGWTLAPEGKSFDGAWYRAVRGRATAMVEAAWIDVQEPRDVPDWYSLTVGIGSVEPR